MQRFCEILKTEVLFLFYKNSLLRLTVGRQMIISIHKQGSDMLAGIVADMECFGSILVSKWYCFSVWLNKYTRCNCQE